MAEFFDALFTKHTDFIHAQPMFFVASACAEGRVNLSPKGGDGLHRVLDPNRFAYLDLTGSGNETAAHLKHDGRITVMFNSFDRNALILRLYGHGRTIHKGTAEFDDLISGFPEKIGARQICLVEIESVQTSCGYAVPLMDFVAHRDTLDRWADSKGKEGLVDYRKEKNLRSIDGFETGLPAATD